MKLVAALWEERRTGKDRVTGLDRMTKVAVLVEVDVDFLDITLNNGVARYWVKKVDEEGTKKFVECGAPDRVLKRIVGAKIWKLPTVIGLQMCPTMRPDGSLLKATGYDPATALYAYWDDSLVLPTIEDRPSKDDARDALKILQELISGFPFVEEVDKSVAVAGMMTPVLRVAFDLAPMSFQHAHVSGTGKSFYQDVVSTIANGRPCPCVYASEDKTELEKQLSALLLEGVTMIALDNLDHDLKSGLLCQMLSQLTVQPRILGKSKMPEIEWRGTTYANGNNIEVGKDLVRRTLRMDMNVDVERPEKRRFNFNPVHRVLEDRGKYIGAVLTIARAYHCCTDKVTVDNYAGFEGWSRVVREPLVWLGMIDPVDSVEKGYERDPNRNADRELLTCWKRFFGVTESYRYQRILQEANAYEKDGKPRYPDLHDLLMEQCGERGEINPTRFGSWLRSLKGKVYTLDGGRWRIIAATQNKNGNWWKLEKVRGDKGPEAEAARAAEEPPL